MQYDWIDTFLLEKPAVNKDLQQDWNWIRYKIGEKMFAAICLDDQNQPVYITLKLAPLDGDFMRSQYEDIIPGYYMNKQHWNSIKVDGAVPDAVVKDMLDKAYGLVLAGFSKKKQQELLKPPLLFRPLALSELTRELFHDFHRRQVVTLCRRKVNGQWTILSDPFIDEWNEEEYAFLVQCLQHTVQTGGVVYGAFADRNSVSVLKGFVSVEGVPFGTEKEYLDLTAIHVSEDMRGNGFGKKLFELAASWAKSRGAKKLYISAHSAVESQAFYERLGCVEAAEYNQAHVEAEPCDCQLEYVLTAD